MTSKANSVDKDLDEYMSFIDLECLEGYGDDLNSIYFNRDKAKAKLRVARTLI